MDWRAGFLGVLVVLLFWGCSDQKHHSSPSETQEQSAPSVLTLFNFLDQNHQEFRFKITPDHLQTLSPESTHKPLFIMVFSLDAPSAPFITLFNRIQENFKDKVAFLGFLDKAYPQDQIENYTKDHTLHFPMLNPMDSTPFSTPLNSTSWPLPYFLLYDKQGKLYQSYRGALVEEMLTKELQDLIQTQRDWCLTFSKKPSKM